MKQIARPATAAEIKEIVGPLDDAVLMSIVKTEATPAEVIEAFTWRPRTIRLAPSSSTGRAVSSLESMAFLSARSQNPAIVDRHRVNSRLFPG